VYDAHTHCPVVTHCSVSRSLSCHIHHSLPTSHLFILTHPLTPGSNDELPDVIVGSSYEVYFYNNNGNASSPAFELMSVTLSESGEVGWLSVSSPLVVVLQASGAYPHRLLTRTTTNNTLWYSSSEMALSLSYTV
jgi:hypothetical protein